jgi:hypothetical protein
MKEETTQEQPLAGRRRQILDDETFDRLDTPERKSAWVKAFIGGLTRVIRNIGGKS